MRKFRTAMVGCGALAQNAHLPNMQNNPRVELKVACDINADTARECCEKFGAERSATDWHEVIDASDVDLIVLGTHTNLRGELIVPALLSGKPVYTEKPLSTSRDEMIEILKTSRKTKIPVCVGHNRRSSPAILEFKRLLDIAKVSDNAPAPSVNRLGSRLKLPEEKQLQLLFRVNDDARSWKEWIFWDAEGIMFAEMVHFIDLALWFNDAYPIQVFAAGSTRGNFTLIMRFNDGSLTTLQHTMVGHFDYPKELFEATLNNITIAMDHYVEIRQMGLREEPVVQNLPLQINDSKADLGMAGYMNLMAECHLDKTTAGTSKYPLINKGHYSQLDRFLTHIDGEGENPCDIESAIPVNQIAAKFLESARLGYPVQIGPEDWHIPNFV